MNLITAKQVASKLGCSDSFVWKLVKTDPTFPRPFKIGVGEVSARATRWVDESIDKWITSRAQGEHDEDGRTSSALHQGAGSAVAAEG